jgi:hypothetical protein
MTIAIEGDLNEVESLLETLAVCLDPEAMTAIQEALRG